MKSKKRSVSPRSSFISELKHIVWHTREQAYRAINYAQITTNWLLGKRLIEQEQQGKQRAEYGEHIIDLASKALTKEFGKGFSPVNLVNFRKFYLEFSHLRIHQAVPDESLISAKTGVSQIHQAVPDESAITAKKRKISAKSGTHPIRQALPAESSSPQKSREIIAVSATVMPQLLPENLSWSHYERLIRVDDADARAWYLREAATQMWSYRTLDRNISSQYYERLLCSPAKKKVKREMRGKTGKFQNDKLEFIKNPLVAEFLGLSSNSDFSESELEGAIIGNMSKFLMELGKGFSFVARQKLIKTKAENYYVDLVFYNYILKCFVLIDLKTTRITHQDVGQMDMYVRMYDQLQRTAGDNPTIGILLCSDTDEDIARYSILRENKQLFATKYKLYLPTEKELRKEIERQKAYFKQQQQRKGIV